MTSSSLALVRLETRLFLREPLSMLFGLVFPPLLLVAMGLLFPGFDEPLPELGGDRLIDVYAPTVIGLGLAMLAVMLLPITLSSYREIGILRRLKTTPVHPRRLLLAQVTANVLVSIVSAIATVLVARYVFDVPFPESVFWFVISFLLGVTAMFALGLLIGAIARSATSSQVYGFALFFPLLFFAGVYVPRPFMSDGVLAISNLTPIGAPVQAMMDAWEGMTPEPLHLIVALGYTLVFGVLAIRLFRWE